MKTFFKVFALFFITAHFLSCGSSSSGGDFSVKPSTSNIILLDTTARSCQTVINNPTGTSDVPAMSFNMQNLTIAWSGAKPLKIQYINFSLKSPQIQNGSQVCQIVGDELGYAWLGSAYTATNLPNVPAQASGSNFCPFKCGSISLVDKKRDAYGIVDILVYATTTGPNGDDVPAIGTASVNFQYTGLPQ